MAAIRRQSKSFALTGNASYEHKNLHMIGSNKPGGPLGKSVENQPPSTGAGRPVLAIVNALALADIVSMADAIELMSVAMQEISRGGVTAPERGAVAIAPKGKLILMPGAIAGINRFGIKVLSLFSDAASNSLPGHQGLMLLFDSENGRPLCAVDSHAVTGLRTAAASAMATRVLSSTDSRSLALIGCGALAQLHAEAISLVRPIEEIIVWGRSIEKARQFADRCAGHLAAKLVVARSAQEAVERADIVCTLTSSPLPVLEGKWLRAGQHLNLVGSSTRATREVDDDAVTRGRFIVDSRSHAVSQAGELRHAIESGSIGEQHLAAEIGEVLAGHAVGRSDRSTITIYKSLGHVAQDIRVADAAFSRLSESSHVVYVDW
jgi:ornithine cyclodeaminase/alanine dehydrogenase-like protein (mu-crystallin family)